MTEKLAKANQSLEKALHIIEIMAASPEPMRLQDIAQESGIPPSTALRLINTLQSAGYALQDRVSLRYSLSLKFAQIGSLVASSLSIQNLVRPYLTELTVRCGESACLAIEQDFEVVYVDVKDGPDNMLQIMQRIGKRAPLHCTGVGKLMLADFSGEKLKTFLSGYGLPTMTPNTIATPDELLRELQQIREQGYALDLEECEVGAKCVAAPIRNYTGHLAAAISVSGPALRMTGERIAEILPILLETTDKISSALSY